MIEACVVDASVAVKLFLHEELSDKASELFAQLATARSPAYYVPDHFFIECANVLWKYVRRFGYDPIAAIQNLTDLRELPWCILSTHELAQASLIQGLEWGVAAYDAAYLVLAESAEVPLVTADRKLIKLLDGSCHDVRWLGDVL